MLGAGTLLNGRYRIINLVGKGNFGRVYEAKDTNLFDLRVAVKELDIASINPPERLEATSSFNREAQFLNALDHLGLPRLLDNFQTPGCHYFVMDFLDGKTLTQVIKERKNTQKPISSQEAVAWMREVLEILEYLHSQPKPIVFRDVSPNNIMIMADNRVMLFDLGITLEYDPNAPQTAYGTPNYVAPEQFARKAEPRSDIFSVGRVLFDAIKETGGKITPLVQRVVDQACANDPTRRFQSATAMIEALSNPKFRQFTPDSRVIKHLADSISVWGKQNWSRFRSLKDVECSQIGAFYHLILTYYQSGHLEEALKTCKQLYSYVANRHGFCKLWGSRLRGSPNPEVAYIVWIEAVILRSLGKIKTAKANLRKACNFHPAQEALDDLQDIEKLLGQRRFFGLLGPKKPKSGTSKLKKPSKPSWLSNFTSRFLKFDLKRDFKNIVAGYWQLNVFWALCWVGMNFWLDNQGITSGSGALSFIWGAFAFGALYIIYWLCFVCKLHNATTQASACQILCLCFILATAFVAPQQRFQAFKSGTIGGKAEINFPWGFLAEREYLVSGVEILEKVQQNQNPLLQSYKTRRLKDFFGTHGFDNRVFISRIDAIKEFDVDLVFLEKKD